MERDICRRAVFFEFDINWRCVSGEYKFRGLDFSAFCVTELLDWKIDGGLHPDRAGQRAGIPNGETVRVAVIGTVKWVGRVSDWTVVVEFFRGVVGMHVDGVLFDVIRWIFDRPLKGVLTSWRVIKSRRLTISPVLGCCPHPTLFRSPYPSTSPLVE